LVIEMGLVIHASGAERSSVRDEEGRAVAEFLGLSRTAPGKLF
jgi:hypothetical protein